MKTNKLKNKDLFLNEIFICNFFLKIFYCFLNGVYLQQKFENEETKIKNNIKAKQEMNKYKFSNFYSRCFCNFMGNISTNKKLLVFFCLLSWCCC